MSFTGYVIGVGDFNQLNTLVVGGGAWTFLAADETAPYNGRAHAVFRYKGQLRPLHSSWEGKCIIELVDGGDDSSDTGIKGSRSRKFYLGSSVDFTERVQGYLMSQLLAANLRDELRNLKATVQASKDMKSVDDITVKAFGGDEVIREKVPIHKVFVTGYAQADLTNEFGGVKATRVATAAEADFSIKVIDVDVTKPLPVIADRTSNSMVLFRPTGKPSPSPAALAAFWTKVETLILTGRYDVQHLPLDANYDQVQRVALVVLHRTRATASVGVADATRSVPVVTKAVSDLAGELGITQDRMTS